MENGLNIERKLIYPDHYEFTENEISNIVKEANKNKNQIIMTEKDYFKINDFKLDEIKYLKVSLVVNEKENLLKTIYRLYDQNN